MNKAIHFSSKSNEWATPQKFFDDLNDEFEFTLAPCANESNHKCDKYYTVAQNGLIQNWGGEIVFCNPPYGREVTEWVRKFFHEVYAGDCHCAVMLLPARTDTKWFHSYIYNKAEVRFIKGRLKFGGSKDAAPFPSMVVIFRSCEKFEDYRRG